MRLCRYGAATAAHNERMVSLPQGGGPAATSRDTGERFPARRAAPVTGHGNQRAATNSADSPAGRLDHMHGQWTRDHNRACTRHDIHDPAGQRPSRI